MPKSRPFGCESWRCFPSEAVLQMSIKRSDAPKPILLLEQKVPEAERLRGTLERRCENASKLMSLIHSCWEPKMNRLVAEGGRCGLGGRGCFRVCRAHVGAGGEWVVDKLTKHLQLPIQEQFHHVEEVALCSQLFTSPHLLQEYIKRSECGWRPFLPPLTPKSNCGNKVAPRPLAPCPSAPALLGGNGDSSLARTFHSSCHCFTSMNEIKHVMGDRSGTHAEDPCYMLWLDLLLL